MFQEQLEQHKLSEDMCVICQCDLKHEEAPEHQRKTIQEKISSHKYSQCKMKLPCGHDNFHKSCIKGWLNQKPQCPLCKVYIEDADTRVESDNDYDDY